MNRFRAPSTGVVLIVLLLSVSLSGCVLGDPPARNVAITGLYLLDDGRPAMIVDPCPKSALAGVSAQVMHVEPDASPAAGPSGTVASVRSTGFTGPYLSWSARPNDAHGVRTSTTVPLLSVPAGWHGSSRGATEQSEAVLVPTARYFVRTDLINLDGDELIFTTWPQFTLADLAALAPGQVWAAPTFLDPVQAMSLADFHAAAAASCALRPL